MRELGRWHTVRERGSVWGIRTLVLMLRLFGLGLARLALHPVVAYFLLTSRRGRTASLRYLQRIHEMPGGPEALGRRPGVREQYRHLYSFAVTALEQFKFWSGSFDEFSIEVEGFHYLRSLADEGRGALLFGAHLGNFAVLRVLAQEQALPINVVMYRGHVPRFNTVLREMAPESELRILEHDPSVSTSILEIKKCIDRGEFVSLLADRVPPGELRNQRVVQAPFLGCDAPFPQGPWILASLLRCPVLWTCGLRTGPNGYRVMARPLADRVDLPRGRREESLKAYLARYANILEELCLERPFQWFNIYDFWHERDD